MNTLHHLDDSQVFSASLVDAVHLKLRKWPRVDRVAGRGMSLIAPILARVVSLFLSDTTPTRLMLSVAALSFAGKLWWPGNMLASPTYAAMSWIAEPVWAAMWTVYAIALVLRTFFERRGLTLALAINLFGFLLFSAVTWSIGLSGEWPSISIVVTLSAGWVLVRTGIKPSPGWRND